VGEAANEIKVSQRQRQMIAIVLAPSAITLGTYRIQSKAYDV
jgi:hypothetical protein